jgi:hypothetical protein
MHWQKIRRAIQNKRRGMLSAGIVFLHDNARPHTARWTASLLQEFIWEVFNHTYLLTVTTTTRLTTNPALSLSQRLGMSAPYNINVTRGSSVTIIRSIVESQKQMGDKHKSNEIIYYVRHAVLVNNL